MPQNSSSHTPLVDNGSIAVERAMAELRAGRPVVITGASQNLLIGSAETLDFPAFEQLARRASDASTPFSLLLSEQRLHHLGVKQSGGGAIALPKLDVNQILALTAATQFDQSPVGTPLPIHGEAALELARLSLILPALIAAPVVLARLPRLVLRAFARDILRQRAREVVDLHIISRAPVPLEGTEGSEFVVFRGGEGFRDQIAVIVGQPDFNCPIPVRLHSACLTGDVFGSMKCDCGDQLRFTVQRMAQMGGGIVLYLDQEGRGNGIANKIRAYRLQADGYDTYDADALLGFGLDQRRFDFAAEMLRQLGVKSVELFTNNPLKVAALQTAGLDVVGHSRIYGRRTEDNHKYLDSKRDRAGHMLSQDWSHPAGEDI